MISAARLVFSSSKYDSISPLLHRLHWLKAPARIQYKLAVLAFASLYGTAPSYLADEFLLHSCSSSRLEVVFAQRPHHHHYSSVLHDCRMSATELFLSLLVLAAALSGLWNELGLPRHVTSAPSVQVFCGRLKITLSTTCFPTFGNTCEREVTFVIIRVKSP